MQRREECADAVRLRPVEPRDVSALFEIQSDPEANVMAGTKPRSREAFFALWDRCFADPHVTGRVIEVDGVMVGSTACFQADGLNCIGYWIARQHWRKGIASQALQKLLAEEARRPLHATTLRANTPSQRVLTKCGFRLVGFSTGEESERFVAGEIADFVLE
jgi:RimJ/RimL family protein N-acetyltransferase